MPNLKLSTGASLHYEEMRRNHDDCPVLLIHGMLGTARSHLGHVMDWLYREGFDVIGLTLRGYGQSRPKPRDFPDNFYYRDADDLLAFMGRRRHRKSAPDWLLRWRRGGADRRRQVSETRRLLYRYRRDRQLRAGIRPVFQRMYPGEWISDEDRARHGFSDAAKFTGEWVRAMTRMIDAGGDVSLSLAANIACPLLIMLGRDDKLNPQHYGRRLYRAGAPWQTRHVRLWACRSR